MLTAINRKGIFARCEDLAISSNQNRAKGVIALFHGFICQGDCLFKNVYVKIVLGHVWSVS